MGKLSDFFSEKDKKAILDAIAEAEKATSGEIRVRIESHAKDPMRTAREAFKKLGMRNTELHNGVMFLLAVEDKIFVILGDDGIDEKVPEGFWDDVKNVVIREFRDGRFTAGLVEGIKLAGEQLAEFFPHRKGDVNELPDAISFADEEE